MFSLHSFISEDIITKTVKIQLSIQAIDFVHPNTCMPFFAFW